MASTLWKHPSPHLTRLDAFRRQINSKYGLHLQDYDSLHAWTVENIDLFYAELWEFSGLVTSRPPTKVAESLDQMWPRPRWFPGAELNFTENVLATGLAAHADKIAVSACREGGSDWRHLTWTELRGAVAQYATALKVAGINKGDRIAMVATNSLEALLIALAAGARGAIFSSTSPDMGPGGIVQRFAQIKPKILFIESQVLYAKKRRDSTEAMTAAYKSLKAEVEELKQVVLINSSSVDPEITTMEQFLDVPCEPLQFAQVPFDHPIYILFTSGTTGVPKCICHSGGAVLMKHKVDLALGMDMGVDSSYYQYTTTGWMMWNMLIGSLSLGSRIVLYDGSPLHPSPKFQIQLLQDQGITHWGTSPKFLATLRKDLEQSGGVFNLEGLQTVLVSGAALSNDIAAWFYSGPFPKHVGLHNGSGGTDLVGGIVGSNNLSTVRGNEMSSPVLGMKLEIWDDDGRNIEASGEKGELVVTKPFISMPVAFWGDENGERYHDTYFAKHPGVWSHGDFISRSSPTGGYAIHGRSDGVLNPGGVRFGTAELYDVISRFPEVDDCVAVGKRVSLRGANGKGDERVFLFIKMRAGGVLTEDLKSRVAAQIRTTLSARHVPQHMFQVKDIPYTLNGKKIENAVKSIISGEQVKARGSIANPECLDEYTRFSELPLLSRL